ncbi:hypothetical protein A2160_05235 [Candidatus Beckwithbacteria bacterium RBG_13_42_9]|uniref:Uncharacterized protein n=1 Tax=Candidatus Beckwithbacteria bacterium RBG_13_42_9 TaxID=1797457 RepID=A0A1F5E6T7_9BACT|nr:MAG: hypothetical protein A2160_05235 [Candidatus Beckwithbacteria bacterium RBG_13_42_9]
MAVKRIEIKQDIPPLVELHQESPEGDAALYQVVILGELFPRALNIEPQLMAGRRGEVIGAWDEQGGVEVHTPFDPSNDHPDYTSGAIPVVALDPYSHTDTATIDAQPTLATVRSHGASRVKPVDVDVVIVAAGGDPNAQSGLKSDTEPGHGFFTEHWNRPTKRHAHR